MSRRIRLARAGWFLVLAWFVVGPWPRILVEDPLFEQDAISLNAARVQALKDAAPELARGDLRAAAVKVDLTDALKQAGIDVATLSLAGYGKRLHRTATGVSDPLFVRALAFENGNARLVIVAADVLLITRELVDETMRALAARGSTIARDEIYFTATHTHSGVGGFGGKWGEYVSFGRRQDDIVSILGKAVARAVDEASHVLEPAELGAASSRTGDGWYVQNRTVPKGRSNDYLDTLAVRSLKTRELLASVIVFSAHATCRSSKDMTVSADYPGVLTRRVEECVGGVSLFLAGAVGSMGPAEMGPPRSRWSEWLGKSLGEEAVHQIRDIQNFHRSVSLGMVAADLSVPEPRIKLSRNWRLSPILSGLLWPHEARFQAARLGDWLLLGAPADFSGEIALDLRESNPVQTVIVTSFSGDYLGYALPPEHDDLPSYEAETASVHGRFGGEVICRNILMLKDLVAK